MEPGSGFLSRSWRRAGSEQIAGYRHHRVMLSIVGTELSLPIELEAYGVHDSECGRAACAAANDSRLSGGRRRVRDRSLSARLRRSSLASSRPAHGNLPELSQAAQKCFSQQVPKLSFRLVRDRVEVWDADDFDPWLNLRWLTVRVLCYRQHKPDGTQ